MIKKAVSFIFFVFVFLSIVFIFLPRPAYSQPPILNFEELAKEVEQKYQYYIDYNMWVLEYKEILYKTQYIEGIIIFFVVLFILFIGLYLSFMQFKSSESNQTTIKISKDSIQITSSVIGLLILLISLVFFYIYLKEVYTLK